MFYFTLYLQPKDLESGLLDHHSKFELIKTDKVEKEFVSNIVKKVNVFSSIEHWMQILDTDVEPPFFCRQLIKAYGKDNEQFVPQIPKKICVCG